MYKYGMKVWRSWKLALWMPTVLEGSICWIFFVFITILCSFFRLKFPLMPRQCTSARSFLIIIKLLDDYYHNILSNMWNITYHFVFLTFLNEMDSSFLLSFLTLHNQGQLSCANWAGATMKKWSLKFSIFDAPYQCHGSKLSEYEKGPLISFSLDRYTQPQTKHAIDIFDMFFLNFFLGQNCLCILHCWLKRWLKTQNHSSVTSAY